MIDLGRDNELPRVLIQQLDDGLLDLLLGDYVAVTDQHVRFWMAGCALRRRVAFWVLFGVRDGGRRLPT
ncbi:hypothetical protein QV13_25230 [Mesorhizobium hungaricum]|jgi:hypothetical protein|uniref:Uncharacterized protein n=1 Tax=Mesorhizobium hungaricum TaxID=1566387 RepID=A0A1C2DDP2_9HYPH|nr:hypothetical protein QV13_25230 [Mesorhizobium hungaricum]